MAEQALEILVVDDESALRETLKRSFALEGHHVVAVADGSPRSTTRRPTVTTCCSWTWRSAGDSTATRSAGAPLAPERRADHHAHRPRQ